jgi:hypothetical protein
MHYMACKEAVYERLQATQGGSPAASPSASPARRRPGPVAQPRSVAQRVGSPPPPAFKNEKPEGTPLAKSEDAQKIEKLEHGLNKAMRAIEILSTPMRKSLTGTDFVPKPGAGEKPLRKAEQMSKTEITQVLTAKAADPKLSKADRDQINQYMFGVAELKDIQHLLEQK